MFKEENSVNKYHKRKKDEKNKEYFKKCVDKIKEERYNKINKRENNRRQKKNL